MCDRVNGSSPVWILVGELSWRTGLSAAPEKARRCTAVTRLGSISSRHSVARFMLSSAPEKLETSLALHRLSETVLWSVNLYKHISNLPGILVGLLGLSDAPAALSEIVSMLCHARIQLDHKDLCVLQVVGVSVSSFVVTSTVELLLFRGQRW